MRAERPVTRLLQGCRLSLLLVGADAGLTEGEKMTPIDTRLQSVCSCYFWEPSTQPGELLVMPLRAGGPGKIHMGWVRGTQSWPGAHVLWSLSPWPRFFWLSPIRRRALLLCQPFRGLERLEGHRNAWKPTLPRDLAGVGSSGGRLGAYQPP